MELADLFFQEQINQIRSIIIRQCQRHMQREMNFQDLCYAPYAGNRAEHSITTSILSGFRAETEIEGFTISTQKYGLNEKMGHPLLESETVIAHIFNSGCGFKSIPFKENCSLYNSELEKFPIYVCIVFDASNNGVLKNISIKIPNSNGVFIEEFEIFNFKSNNEALA